jgi:periplasmic protein TonB
MFESSLISLDKKKPARRRWLSLPIAVALHLFALATFTFAGYWHVEGIAEPPSNESFIIEATLPELPQAPIAKGTPAPPVPEKTAVKAAETPRTETPVQPKDAPETLPTPAAPVSGVTPLDLPVPGDPRGIEGADPRGDLHGVIGVPFGGGKGPGAGVRRAAADDAPIPVGGAVLRPIFLSGPQPRYTEMARKAGIQGSVIVEAIIDEQGRVTHVRMLKDLSLGLGEAAVEAIQSWRFKPATLAGRAVKVYYTLTVNFTLQR